MLVRTGDGLLVGSEFSDLRVLLDPDDGSPVRLVDGERELALRCRVEVTTGGREIRGPVGGLQYVDTAAVVPGGGIGSVSERVGTTSRTVSVPVATVDGLALTWHYVFRTGTPRLAVGLDVRVERTGIVVRNVHLTLTPVVGDAAGWRLQAPGNRLRPDLDLASLAHATTVLPVAGVDGSAGLVALDRDDPATTILVWPLSQTEIGDTWVSPGPDGPVVDWQTDVAGEPGAGGVLAVRSLFLDLLDQPFASVLPTVPGMLAAQGITSPADPPAWAVGANLYEVQIGFSVFKGGHRYEPYPTAQALLEDLDRIADLGFTALQIMPRQPYPSYNVHDLDDVTTSWGEEDVLRRVVAEAHARGMHVILDILMHGVIDGDALDATLEGIRNGPYADRLEDVMPDITVLERHELDWIAVTWSRHVVDFEPYWRAGSPQRHPLVDEHPEWFCRDSSGRVTGMYTEAFDAAHPGWQRWFIDKALGLMDRLGIDGFRFDAPSYNYFHNWSPRTRSDASVSMLGAVSLFDRIRPLMRSRNLDAVLYTEPSGALFRRAMDVNYNYDEQWLVRAVMTGGSGNPHWVRSARELATWFAHRDATLPSGSLTAHHLDSHDTFWWPDWGSRWRREQYGAPAAAALMTVFALCGGPYMTFVGGEEGVEDAVRRVNRLRRDEPLFGAGGCDWSAVRVEDDDVFTVVRTLGARRGVVLVNLADRRVRTVVRVRGQDRAGATPDLLGGEALHWERDADGVAAELRLAPFGAVVVDLDAAPEPA